MAASAVAAHWWFVNSTKAYGSLPGSRMILHPLTAPICEKSAHRRSSDTVVSRLPTYSVRGLLSSLMFARTGYGRTAAANSTFTSRSLAGLGARPSRPSRSFRSFVRSPARSNTFPLSPRALMLHASHATRIAARITRSLRLTSHHSRPTVPDRRTFGHLPGLTDPLGFFFPRARPTIRTLSYTQPLRHTNIKWPPRAAPRRFAARFPFGSRGQTRESAFGRVPQNVPDAPAFPQTPKPDRDRLSRSFVRSFTRARARARDRPDGGKSGLPTFEIRRRDTCLRIARRVFVTGSAKTRANHWPRETH